MMTTTLRCDERASGTTPNASATRAAHTRTHACAHRYRRRDVDEHDTRCSLYSITPLASPSPPPQLWQAPARRAVDSAHAPSS